MSTFDFGFTSEEEVKETKSGDDRAERLLVVITTFLENLKLNPKSTTIKWPNRVAEIEDFQERLRAIVDGEPNVPNG